MKESQLENKTAIATNDYVRMVDENGNSVKIKKDSFMAAIRDALPSIISDGETGGGSVLSIINGALKSRTDANLASVLGVNANIRTYVYDLGGSAATYTTQESVNGNSRCASLILVSIQFSAGNNTAAGLYVLRKGHSGNYGKVTNISYNSGDTRIIEPTFSISNEGYLQINGNGYIHLLFLNI